MQSTNETADGSQPIPTPKPDGSDVFDVPGFSRTTQATLSLKQPPKWLRRPISSSFGYGGKLISISNLASAQGKNQSSVVHVHKVVTEQAIVDRAISLKEATEGGSLNAFAQDKCNSAEAQASHDSASWKALCSLFNSNSREELVTLLGFSKSEIAARVAEAVEKIKTNMTPTQIPSDDLDLGERRPHEPVVSFAEPESSSSTPEPDRTPSEKSVSVISDRTDGTKAVDVESTTTVPSLFGDEVGTPQFDAETDFFSTIGTLRSTLPDQVQIPHTNYAHDSSVAATIGSRPSSAASEVMKNNTFRIYPSEESEVDRLVTKSLVLGDFESAVTLCLSAERYADAILLAVKGGSDLLQRTQKTYFEKRTVNLPYLRLFQSIVTEDLDDIVQNADLQEWREAFVVLCTFAKADEFANLAEQLGQRLEFQASLIKGTDPAGAEEFRKNATLTYLAAGRLEKVVNIWIEEMTEEERRLLEGYDDKSSSRYSAHVRALQTFMEKVAVFRGATKYVDADLKVTPDPSGVRTYRLASLYERYFEYADLLAIQGLLSEAVNILQHIPSEYQISGGSGIDVSLARERLLSAADTSQPVKAGRKDAVSSTSTASYPSQSAVYGYQSYTSQQASVAPTGTVRTNATAYEPVHQTSSTVSQPANPYAPSTSSASVQQPYQSIAPMQPYTSVPYSTTGPYNPPTQAVQVPAPPSLSNASQPSTVLPPPPPKKRENGGWNDAPVVVERRTPAPHPPSKVTPITAPFPNATGSPSAIPGSPVPSGPSHGHPPPPRPGSVNRGPTHGPPPNANVHRPPSVSQQGPPQGYGPPPGRAFSPLQQGVHQPALPPPRASQFAPPGRDMSPQNPQAFPRQPPPSQFAGQSPRPSLPPGAGAPGPYARATPPPGWSGPGGQGAPNVQGITRSPPSVQPQSLSGPYGPPPVGPTAAAPPPITAPQQLASSSRPPPSAQSAGPPGGAVRPPPTKTGPPPPKYRTSLS